METRTLGGWVDQYKVGNEVGEMVTGVAQECLESEWLVLRVGIESRLQAIAIASPKIANPCK